MDTELQLISDGTGLAVIGDPGAVELFLQSEGLSSRALDLSKVAGVAKHSGAAAQAGADIAANSGRWVKLTEESAKAVKKYGLRESSKSGLSTGVIKGPKGQVKGFVEFAKTPAAALTNPAVLAGAAGIMTQLAMQQTMEEITAYLAAIDQKVDDILRAQKDAALAEIIGTGMLIDEATTIRNSVGKVSDVTWSKIQAAPATIATTQAYALRRLNALSESLDGKSVKELAKALPKAQTEASEWVAVLARCFQLTDSHGVLELERVLDSSPEDIGSHEMGLRTARQERLERITHSTIRLLSQLDEFAATANAKVLLHPTSSPRVVAAATGISGDVQEFLSTLGVEQEHSGIEGKRWLQAAGEKRDSVLEFGETRLRGAQRFGSSAKDHGKSVLSRGVSAVSERTIKRAKTRSESGDQAAISPHVAGRD